MNEQLDVRDEYAVHRVPRRYHLKLTVVGALGWLVAWLYFPWTRPVWLMLFGIYGIVLAGFGLIDALGYRGSVGYREWQVALFRTAGWLIVSGLLSFAIAVIIVIVCALFGYHPFAR